MADPGDIVYAHNENWIIIANSYTQDGVEKALAIQADSDFPAQPRVIIVPS